MAPVLGIKEFFNAKSGFSPVLLNETVGSLPVLGIGVATIIAIIISNKITRKIPASLVGLILGTGLFLLLGKTLVPEFARFESNPFIIGAIPTGFPIPLDFLTISFGDIFAIILR